MSPRPCVESIPAPAFQWIFQRTVSGADDRGRYGSPAKGHTTMLTRLGRLAVRRSRAVLIGVLLTFLGLAAYGAGAQNDLDLARWSSPGTESVRAGDVLREEFGTGNPNLALLVTARDGDVDSASTRDAARALAQEVEGLPLVTDVTSYWDSDSLALRATDGRRALVLVRLEGSATEAREQLATLSTRLTRTTDELTVQVGGQEEISRQVGEQARTDFLRAELFALPAVLLLLVLVYRRTTAALLTVAVGLLSVLGTLAGLRAIAQFTEVSTFAANLALVLGLGLGVDYSLFVISRYREERAAGRPGPDAVVRATAVAGRTVVFSGVTVAVSLCALLVFPFFFLSSFAYAGVLVVVTAVAGAVVFLPAALARWGHRVERPAARTSSGFWHRTALAAMRRPLLAGAGVLTVLLLAASPLLGLRFGLPDERTLPEGTSSRTTSEIVHEEFPAEPTDTIQVVLTKSPTGTTTTATTAATRAYAAELSSIQGVFQVDAPSGTYRDGQRTGAPGQDRLTAPEGRVRLALVPTQEAMRGDVPALVERVRDLPAPDGVLVGGYPGETTDFRATLLDRLPLAAGLVLGATYLILFLMTGSVLLPLKATVLNLLSLAVMFGCLVWVFQDGNLSGVLGFTPTGSIEPSIPVLMFCVAYGLSMDYEVFLLSRIKEEHDRTGDTAHAVAEGIRRSAPLITAAAGILALSFLSYATGGVVFLKEMGIGTALTILVDATLIRVVLLPVTMRLAGRANWWAPKPLRRFRIKEAPEPEPDQVLRREYV
ncbi:MMPL family transporter [Streptomyces phaeochromogenes]|uniref:MMPL family transporter n=1 Tax=Streptomyces phaeochromogenes TaxID=1923 RepID=UPI0022519847|nr:MMPL family transporter [Streptomyces phaeochromogenes]MCX5598982.1 MMPL family transporter [Streptomyces phaeochromogenes]